MKCQRCGSDNLDDAKFCWDCGAELKIKCPSCGREVQSDKKFCPYCGAKLENVELKHTEEIQLDVAPVTVTCQANDDTEHSNSNDIKDIGKPEEIDNEADEEEVAEHEAEFKLPDEVSFSTVINGVKFRFAAWKSYVSLRISIAAAVLSVLIKGFIYSGQKDFSFFEYGSTSFLDIFGFIYWLFDLCYVIPLAIAESGLSSFKDKSIRALYVFYRMVIIINLLTILLAFSSQFSGVLNAFGNTIAGNIAAILVACLEMIYFKKRDKYYNRVDVYVQLL